MVVDILGSGSTPSHSSILSGKADKELVQASYDEKKVLDKSSLDTLMGLHKIYIIYFEKKKVKLLNN